MADVIARHYLDALNAIPGDPDATQIRGQAIAALVRAASRAERTGAQALERSAPPRRLRTRRITVPTFVVAGGGRHAERPDLDGQRVYRHRSRQEIQIGDYAFRSRGDLSGRVARRR